MYSDQCNRKEVKYLYMSCWDDQEESEIGKVYTYICSSSPFRKSISVRQ